MEDKSKTTKEEVAKKEEKKDAPAKSSEAKSAVKTDKVKSSDKKKTESKGAPVKKANAGGKKEVKKILRGQAHIKSTYNNTIVSITDLSGNVLGWGSAGRLGFKGAKKATPYAATLVTNNTVEKVKKYGLQEVDVLLKGIGAGREAAIRALQSFGLQVMSIKDVTPIPHNGCRSRKPRRV